ncbi:MAG: hypothetical protein ABW198_07770 [Pseudorhodoplanes sp.]
MTVTAKLKARFLLAGWKMISVRAIRVAYTASQIGLAMMAPAHAQPSCVAVPLTVDCKAASIQTPPPAVWLP